jgi:nucleoside-diphosphate-sugar epimerase
MERHLDHHEVRHAMRIIRLRPALIFQRASASEQRRLFAGPFVPSPLLRRGRLPALPAIAGVRFQAVHADDVAEAYRLALTSPNAHGAYNVAAEPVLDLPAIAHLRRTRSFRLPQRFARAAFAAAYALRLHPSEPSWLDVALETPLISSDRIRRELPWLPDRSGLAAIDELFDGLADGAGGGTPPLASATGFSGRFAEVRGGIGRSTPDVPH